jgi:quercetin dioxygenase-like cupin family protein
MRPPRQLALVLFAAAGCAPPPKPVTTEPKVVAFGPSDRHWVEILDGPSMESGVVALAPGTSAGAHDTKDYEEVVIPLEGRGELRIAGRAPIPLGPGMAAYTPPHTAHDVANAGDAVFRYVFVAAKTR